MWLGMLAAAPGSSPGSRSSRSPGSPACSPPTSPRSRTGSPRRAGRRSSVGVAGRRRAARELRRARRRDGGRAARGAGAAACARCGAAPDAGRTRPRPRLVAAVALAIACLLAGPRLASLRAGADDGSPAAGCGSASSTSARATRSCSRRRRRPGARRRRAPGGGRGRRSSSSGDRPARRAGRHPPDSDHAGGRGCRARRARRRPPAVRTTAPAPSLRRRTRRGIPTRRLSTGGVLRSGALRLRVLWPPRLAALDRGPALEPNLRSLVMLARWQRFRMLLTGDAEAELAPVHPGPVDVLKVAHHGSEDAGLAGLLDETRSGAGGDLGRRRQPVRPPGAGDPGERSPRPGCRWREPTSTARSRSTSMRGHGRSHRDLPGRFAQRLDARVSAREGEGPSRRPFVSLRRRTRKMEASGTPTPAGEPAHAAAPAAASGQRRRRQGRAAAGARSRVVLGARARVRCRGDGDRDERHRLDADLRGRAHRPGGPAIRRECFDGSSTKKTISLILGWPSGVLAGLAALLALYFAATGRRGRLAAAADRSRGRARRAQHHHRQHLGIAGPARRPGSAGAANTLAATLAGARATSSRSRPAYLIAGTDAAKIDAALARLRARAEARGRARGARGLRGRRRARAPGPDAEALIARDPGDVADRLAPLPARRRGRALVREAGGAGGRGARGRCRRT